MLVNVANAINNNKLCDYKFTSALCKETVRNSDKRTFCVMYERVIL